SSAVTSTCGSLVAAAPAASQVTVYVQDSSPSASHVDSSTLAGGRPNSTVAWDSIPCVYWQWRRNRRKPSLAFPRATTRPGSTSKGTSSSTVLNLVAVSVNCS